MYLRRDLALRITTAHYITPCGPVSQNMHPQHSPSIGNRAKGVTVYREELIALMMSVAEWWRMLDNADLTNVTHAEDLAEKAQEVELAANGLSSEFMGLAHFLEEVRR